MQQHHDSANPHEVGAVGETNEAYGGDMMNHLLLEILEHTCNWEQSVRRKYGNENVRSFVMADSRLTCFLRGFVSVFQALAVKTLKIFDYQLGQMKQINLAVFSCIIYLKMAIKWMNNVNYVL